MNLIRKILLWGMTTLLMSNLFACTEWGSNTKTTAAMDNMQLGLAYIQQQKASLAKEKLLLAVSQAPQNSEVLDAMAYFLALTGDNKEAEQYYQQAIVTGVTHNGAAFNNYGVFLCRQKKPWEAEKMFLKALSDPYYLESANAYNNAGWCMMSVSKFSRAQIYFRKAARQNLNGQ